MKKLFPLVCICLGLIQVSFGQSELVVKKNGGLTLIEVTNNQRNVFLGDKSGAQAVTGLLGQPNALDNTAVGNNSMQYLSTGDGNTALGSAALGGVRTGHSNVGIGMFALLNTNDGIWNIGIGRNALVNSISGSGNIGIGRQALQEVQLGFNTGVGHESGRENLGENNTFLGAWSGRNNTGSNNVYLGKEAGRNIMGSNKLVIENSDVDSTEALIYGEFDNDLLRLNALVNINGHYTLPTTTGAESQVMSINSAGQAVWDSLIFIDQDSTNELIQSIGVAENAIAIIEGSEFHTAELLITRLNDTDNDTRITVNKDNVDEDVIRFDVKDKERVNMSVNEHGTFTIEVIDSLGNTGVGEHALSSNNSGIGNTAYSRNALRFNQVGTGNVALGRAAMQFSVSGDYNTYVGDLAGFKNDGGSYNVGLGSLTLAENVTGTGNVGLGHFAGYHETGSNKLYIANDSVRSNEALIYGEFDTKKLRLNAEVEVDGKYVLPTEEGQSNQFMIMREDGKLEWFSELEKQLGIDVTWGFINSNKEVYDGLDTFTYTQIDQIQTPMILDQDGDTKITVQDISGADEDKIDMTIDGTLRYTIKNTGLGNSVIEQHNNNENIFIGRHAGQSSTGGKNTFVGYKAGEDVLNGEYNTYLGKSAGQSAKGGYNVIVGEYSGANVKGDYNTTLGVNSGRSIEGDRNLILGAEAARNAKGDYNVFIGNEAGYFANSDNKLYIENTDADSTEALIYGEFDTNKLRLNAEVNINEKMFIQQNASDEVQISIPTIYRNIFIGDQSGNANTPSVIFGQDNVFVGDQTGKSNTEGYGNTVVGSVAGSTMSTGIQNSFIGSYAGQNNNGSSNTFIGNGSGLSNVSGSGNIFIGDKSGSNETGSNKLYIANDDHDEDNALIYGEFDTNKLRINGDLGIGTNANHSIHVVDNFPALKLALGSNLGATTRVSADFWQTRLSSSSNVESKGVDMSSFTFEPFEDNTLSLGTAAFKWTEVFATNSTINTSDRRFKKNINDINYGLETVMQMRPVSYQWKKEANGRTINGFIAQEMEQVVPEVVHISEVTPNANKPGTESEYSELYGMRYTELIPVLTKAIQDQQALIEALTERIQALEKK